HFPMLFALQSSQGEYGCWRIQEAYEDSYILRRWPRLDDGTITPEPEQTLGENGASSDEIAWKGVRIMSQFRLVEHPKGKWSVEKKGWFGWKGVFFYGDPLVFSTISGLAAAHSPLPVGSVFTFKS